MAFPTIGLNIANLLGIGPLTKLGEDLGDFVPPYLVIVGVTLLTIVLVVLTASSDTKPETVSIANELSALARPKIWFYTLLAALVFTCWFEIYWNVRIWWTQLNEMPGEWYAIFLIVLGVGLVAGSQIGGMLADRYRKLAIWIPVLGIILGVSVTAIFIHQPIMMLIGVFILGTFIQVICSPIVIQSMQSAPQAPMMSATMFQVGACSGVFMATFAYQFVNSTFGEVAYNPLYIDFALIPLVLVFATLSLIKSSLMKSRKNPAT
jgi:DHA1 family inner membrane transport protein